MNISGFALRLLTLFAYTLPFVFCLNTCGRDGNLKFAFNKNEAIANEKELEKFNYEMLDSAFANLKRSGFNEEVKADIKSNPVYSEKLVNLKKDWLFRLKWPTDYSLSAIGLFEISFLLSERPVFKLLAIMLGISLLLSLLSLLMWPLFCRWKINLFVLLLNLLLVICFIIISWFNHITVEHGGWLLLFLLMVQLLSELKNRYIQLLEHLIVFRK
ncbi:MAG: hypothetical protein IT236_08935 [Bacteroidia bacterium]|nr:hypothetical protein [Bacteroidia bacterium]